MRLVLTCELDAVGVFGIELVDPARPGEVLLWTADTVRAADALAVRAAGLRTGERAGIV